MTKRQPPYLDFKRMTSVPVRDFERDGAPIAFWVDVYGLTAREMAIVPGGGWPALKAVTRLGLDPVRYQATIWDLPI